jgi:hypothetical protein
MVTLPAIVIVVKNELRGQVVSNPLRIREVPGSISVLRPAILTEVFLSPQFLQANVVVVL